MIVNYTMNESDAVKLLHDFHRIASDMSLPYMLYGGTCLGAVRDMGFIPVDLDVDFCCKH